MLTIVNPGIESFFHRFGVYMSNAVERPSEHLLIYGDTITEGVM